MVYVTEYDGIIIRDRELKHETFKYEDVRLRDKSFVNVPYLQCPGTVPRNINVIHGKF
jgi:hypothetical protein